jgi:hypothetical protein
MEYDRNTQLFLSLVNSFQMQAMMQLGKLKNPFTNESERDLDAAQISIDILDMVKVKTNNNLSEDESRYINQVISDLKLNYVEERNKDGNSAPNEAEKNTSDETGIESENPDDSKETPGS